MKQTIIYLVVSLLIISCGKDTKKESIEEVTETQETTAVKTSEFGRSNFAVVWKWTTTDSQLVSDNMIKISEELNDLWKKDVVENVYYNSDSKVEKLDIFPNISFFLKAISEQEAKSILDNLSIVKKSIASYTLHPVGHLWLKRKSETVNKNSYVSVWTTIGKPTDELTKAQNDHVLALWDKGDIENAYFDIEGTQESNAKTDFVFYVNANSEEEAKAVCNSLPFYKEKISTYKLHEVGVFWMGKYEEK